MSYGGGGERGIKDWRRDNADVGAVAVAPSSTDVCGTTFKREWTDPGVGESVIESTLLKRVLFRIRSSVSLLARRKSILRIRLQLDGLPDVFNDVLD